MTVAGDDWAQRVSELWTEIDRLDEDDFVRRIDLGREREAVAVALTARSTYLPRYNRSVARYAQELAGA
jgi:Tetratrico peptide repeat